VTLKLAVSSSRPSVPYGANLLLIQFFAGLHFDAQSVEALESWLRCVGPGAVSKWVTCCTRSCFMAIFPETELASLVSETFKKTCYECWDSILTHTHTHTDLVSS